MIRSVAELLGSLLSHERSKLDEFDLSHGPTIGKMYEGLAANILDRAIPPQFNLRVISGFIFNDDEQLTGEIDCMLVSGEGLPIPYTSSFKWHIKDVIAVFEIKKTLYSAEILDSFDHLRSVLNSYIRYVRQIEKDGPDEPTNLPFVWRTFAEITQKALNSFSETESLTLHEIMILRTLIIEHASPVRIILGHHGFKSEFSFRESMMTIVEESMSKQQFGVLHFPHLIVSGNYSLLKANGRPYSTPMQDGFWDFCVSSAENPIILLLELIWTRLEEKFKVRLPWGEDLCLERFHRFLSARGIQQGEHIGWEYKYCTLTKQQLDLAANDVMDWSPAFLTQAQFVEINLLCGGEILDIHDPDFIAHAESEELSVDAFVASLLDTGLVAKNGTRLELITEKCVCAVLPTGQFVAAENNTGRLERWIEKKPWEKISKKGPEQSTRG